MKKVKIGIVGATGLVGEKVIKILCEENLIENIDLHLISSEKSAGKRIFVNGLEYRIFKLDETCLNFNLDYVIFSAGDDVSRDWVERFVNSGACVIDNTNAFRRCENVPLVVPEINFNLVSEETKIIANPNCSTIQLVVVLDRLKKLSNISKVIVSTYQSVSGAGKNALLELSNNQNYVFEKGIRNNIIPKIGGIDENGNCTEEDKIVFETNKILNDNIDVIATTVRVPICFCHGESVFVEFENDVDIEEVKKVLDCEYIKFSENELFYPTECVDTDYTYVCRLRKFKEKEFGMFILADNLRRGAAFNAVQILKNIINSTK